MNHELNIVEEAMRTVMYIATAGAGEVDLLLALVLLKDRVAQEIDAALDQLNEKAGEENE